MEYFESKRRRLSRQLFTSGLLYLFKIRKATTSWACSWNGCEKGAQSFCVEKNCETQCDAVIVSTPDILDAARKYRKDAEYVPNPIDSNVFYPKPAKEHTKN